MADRPERRRRRGRPFWLPYVIMGAAVAVGFYFAGIQIDHNRTVNQTTRTLIHRVDGESRTRAKQFCKLILAAHHDKVKRMHDTEVFLASPAGHEPTSLNLFIRKISLPQLKAEIAKETKTLPKVCLPRGGS